MPTATLVGYVQRMGNRSVERYKVTLARNENAAFDITARMPRVDAILGPCTGTIVSGTKNQVRVGNYPLLAAFNLDKTGVTALNTMTAGGTYSGSEPATYTVIITATGTFKWKKNNGTFTTGVAITGSAQTLSDGVQVTFGSTSGYTANDTFVVTAYPSTTFFYLEIEGEGGY